MKGYITKCTNCEYRAITWNEDLICNKCGSKLEIIAEEKLK